jgi:hypothetical protein
VLNTFIMTQETLTVEGFYQACSDLLGTDNNYRPRPYGEHRTRWNNRVAGNGRFEGFGLIRMYGLQTIHICLSKPKNINQVFGSMEDALEYLRNNI